MQASADQIAKIINGKVIGDPHVMVDGPCKIDDGINGKISFLSNPKYAQYIYDTKASVVLVSDDFVPDQDVAVTMISVENVYVALAILMDKFSDGITLKSSFAKSADIDPSAQIGDQTSVDEQVIIKNNVHIGMHCRIYGHVFIGDNVRIGDRVMIYPGVKIYHNTVIGDDVIIHANAVLGSDGFGFAPDADGRYKKIAQVGNVVVGNDVEIGANTTIARATMGSTTIGNGVKLDNLIQIAHNVSIGEHTVIAAQTGIAGSTKIGKRCMIGGQVGIVGHIEIADGTMIQAQSGIASSIKEENSKWYGTPAIEYQNYLRSYAQFRRLSDMSKQIHDLKKTIDNFKSEN
jgi:UDP-3-O-[3-hydroxymyristoyl] glucosamine N-acyltransferase